jgi:hypothetical protein
MTRAHRSLHHIVWPILAVLVALGVVLALWLRPPPKEAAVPAIQVEQLVPRTRSSHAFSAGTVANFGFKSGTRIIDWPVSSSIPKFAQRARRMLANFGIGTLA